MSKHDVVQRTIDVRASVLNALRHLSAKQNSKTISVMGVVLKALAGSLGDGDLRRARMYLMNSGEIVHYVPGGKAKESLYTIK